MAKIPYLVRFESSSCVVVHAPVVVVLASLVCSCAEVWRCVIDVVLLFHVVSVDLTFLRLPSDRKLFRWIYGEINAQCIVT